MVAARQISVLGALIVAPLLSLCCPALIFAATELPGFPPWSYYDGLVGLELVADIDMNGDGFDDLVVGCPGSDYQYDFESELVGSILIFFGSESGLPKTPSDFVVRRDTFEFGIPIFNSGDINQDGFDDLVVADNVWRYTSNGYRGRIVVYFGGDRSSIFDDLYILPATNNAYNFPYTIDTNFDVNGDGYSDIAYNYRDSNGTDIDADDFDVVNLIHGSGKKSIGPDPDWQFLPPSCDRYGSFVKSVGDVNGDQFSDILVRCFDGPQLSANIFFGSPSGLQAVPDTTHLLTPDEYLFWADARRVGDVNGDGYDDVLSPDIDVGIVFKRKLYLFLGSANGLPAAPSKTLAIEDPWNNFLYRLAILPFSRHNDLNHDGRFDVTISTNYTYVRILLGDSSDPLATEDGWSLSPFNQEHDAVGFTLATGDVNGDLKSDLALSVGDIPFGKAPLGYTYSLAAYFAATTTTTTTAPTATTTTTTIPMDDDATDDDATDDDSGIPLDDDARDAADGEDDDEEGCCGC